MDTNNNSLIEEKIIEERPSRASRRKNEWKYAARRNSIYNALYGQEHNRKPLHYYAKNPPWSGYAFEPNKGSRRYISKNYKDTKNWSEHDRRQIDNFENQIDELFDNE